MTDALYLPAVPAGARSRLTVALGLYARWRARRDERAELRRLLRSAPHLLADIGLTPARAAEEAAKPFWRP
jgi:uncharacterized protein YjiS (DUF1127 family)